MLTNGNIIEHGYTTGYAAPTLFSAPAPAIGLINTAVSVSEGVLTCSFDRLKNMSSVLGSNFYDLTQPWYILDAQGQTDSTGKLLIDFLNKYYYLHR